jgi:uncharacterized protein YndB with AHSA1/START domain
MRSRMIRSVFARASLAIALISLQSASCHAEVVDQQANGFSLQHTETINASPDKVYAAFIDPSKWWDSAHTFSGDAKNMTFDARAGGCWCETLKGGGSVLHMTVVYADPGKLLRLRGALGPFQSTGMEGTMNIVFEPNGTGTKLVTVYNLGGYIWEGYQELPKTADGVLGLQFYRLKQLIETGSASTPRPKGEQP